MPLRILVTVLPLVAPGVLSAQEPVLYHVLVRGAVELATARVVNRALEVAAEGSGAVLILELDSPGGRFDAAQLMAADVLESDVPVYVLVSERAWGAAALIALAADSIYMTPNSSIGAGSVTSDQARDLPAAARRALREEFRSLFARRGLEPGIGEAMAPNPEADERDRGLTLEADDAVRRGVAQARAETLEALLSRLGLGGLEVITVDFGWTGTTIEIDNDNPRDVRIYVLRGGTRYSLGLVTSKRLTAFELPLAQLADGARIQVLAEVIGSSERLLTEVIRIEPGIVIRWVLAEPLRYSSYSYFVRHY